MHGYLLRHSLPPVSSGSCSLLIILADYFAIMAFFGPLLFSFEEEVMQELHLDRSDGSSTRDSCSRLTEQYGVGPRQQRNLA
jgi:hypothetical protein